MNHAVPFLNLELLRPASPGWCPATATSPTPSPVYPSSSSPRRCDALSNHTPSIWFSIWPSNWAGGWRWSWLQNRSWKHRQQKTAAIESSVRGPFLCQFQLNPIGEPGTTIIIRRRVNVSSSSFHTNQKPPPLLQDDWTSGSFFLRHHIIPPEFLFPVHLHSGWTYYDWVSLQYLMHDERSVVVSRPRPSSPGTSTFDVEY